VLGLLEDRAQASGEWRVSGIGDYLGSSGNAGSETPKYHSDTLVDTLESAILSLIREDSSIGQGEIAERVGKSVPTVKRAMKRMSDTGIIRRIGGKRFGSWEVL